MKSSLNKLFYMRLLLYKTTMKKIYKVTIMVYAIIFIIGYLGGFKYMNITSLDKGTQPFVVCDG